MNWLKQQSRHENVAYLVLWGMLFAAPILSIYVHTLRHSDMAFQWSEVFFIWQKFAIFLLLFLLHNFLLAPLLVQQHRRTLYFSLTAAIVAAFTVYQCTTRPALPHKHPQFDGPRTEMRHHHPKAPDADSPEAPNARFHKLRGDERPPVIIGEHDIVAVVILVLMFGMNIGIKGFFRGRRDRERLVKLEKENLEQQLEYLKYQLNPHFLMNTLNNIHALIDIEPPKAQEAIIQLSKILRYVLYESNYDRVLMSKEVEFMANYVKLMQMRYGDKLTFTVNSPDDGTSVLTPPLLFISFVENAFKHGVSYQTPSFIEVSGKRYQDTKGGERLLWTCRNSSTSRPTAPPYPDRAAWASATYASASTSSSAATIH